MNGRGWLGLTLAGAVTFAAQTAGAAPSLLLESSESSISSYDAVTGAALGVFASGGGLRSIMDAKFGPDGNLYVADWLAKTISIFDGHTGAFVRVLTTFATERPNTFAFAPSGELFVGMDQGALWRVDGTTGVALGVFATTPPGSNSVGGVTVHGGSLFVSYLGQNKGSLRRYDLVTGAATVIYADFFFNGPRTPFFDSEDNMYVPDWQTPNVRKFDAPSYTASSSFIVDSELSPVKVDLGPGGELFVLNDKGTSAVRRYDLHTGAFLGTVVSGLPRSSVLLFGSPPATASAVPAIDAAYLALLGISLLALGYRRVSTVESR